MIDMIKLTAISIWAIFSVWFIDLNFEQWNWLKFPLGAAVTSILYVALRYYDSKRKYDLGHTEMLLREYRELIHLHESVIGDLRKENERLKNLTKQIKNGSG